MLTASVKHFRMYLLYNYLLRSQYTDEQNLIATEADDWDQHWLDFSAASELSPSTAYRRRIIEKLLRIKPPGDRTRVLEIGSGSGMFAERFVRKYPRAAFLGLDVSANAVAMSACRVPSATFRQRDLLMRPSNGDDITFGATHAICSEVLEHVDAPEILLRNSAPYMAPGCRLLVTVPGGPINAFYRYIGHRKHYTPAALKTLLSEARFQVEFARGVGFPFLNAYLAALAWRGDKVLKDVAGEPGVALRTASFVFNGLFYLNSMRRGWQIVALAHHLGNSLSTE